LDRSPFDSGSPLINAADEVRRERVMSYDEESRLLSFINSKVGENTAQKNDFLTLRSIIITAVDKGCRKGELITLKWIDVDFLNREINIKAFHTKTAKARTVHLSDQQYYTRNRTMKISQHTIDEMIYQILRCVDFSTINRIGDKSMSKDKHSKLPNLLLLIALAAFVLIVLLSLFWIGLPIE
jgi:integrase